MSDAEPGTPGVDEASRRFGAFMAIVFAVQFVFGLLGVGREGFSVQIFHPLLFAAALAIRNGRDWGRSVLVGFFVIAMVVVALIVLFLGEPAAAVIAVPVEGFLFLHVVAAAFTLANRPPALGFPETWRPWAAHPALHIVLLVLGVLGAFGGGYGPPDTSTDAALP